MFGMGFMEILLIAVVAIIALGPEKLPTAMVDIAKFIKKFKSGLDDAKSTLDNELNIAEMKEEAAKYKAQIEDAKRTLNVKENMNLGLNDIINDDMSSKKVDKDIKEDSEVKLSLKETTASEESEVTKKVQETLEESSETNKEEKPKKSKSAKEKANPADKFKVELEDVDGLEELK